MWPQEWDNAVRPIVARLYKAGVIENAILEETGGNAFAVRELEPKP